MMGNEETTTLRVRANGLKRYKEEVSRIFGEGEKAELLLNTLYHCLGLPFGDQSEYANRRLDSFDLSMRARNCLIRISLDPEKSTVRDLAQYAMGNPLDWVRGIGKRTLRELESILNTGGYEYQKSR